METKKIIISVLLVIALISLINVFSVNQERYTGKASTNIEDCYDSDGGVRPEIGGTLVGSYDSTKAKKDFCANSVTVGEYYCDMAKSDGKLKKVFCEFGCITKNGLGVCSTVQVVPERCEQGCSYNEKCIPVGTRVDGKYCSWDGNLKLQKKGGCENSYECESNFCVSKKCLTEEQWNNFLRDIRVTHWWE